MSRLLNDVRVQYSVVFLHPYKPLVPVVIVPKRSRRSNDHQAPATEHNISNCSYIAVQQSSRLSNHGAWSEQHQQGMCCYRETAYNTVITRLASGKNHKSLTQQLQLKLMPHLVKCNMALHEWKQSEIWLSWLYTNCVHIAAADYLALQSICLSAWQRARLRVEASIKGLK